MTETHPLPIFVYGTLRPGQKNYFHFLQGRTHGEFSATISGSLFLFTDPHGGRYPYLTKGSGTVHGELIFLNPSTWKETLSGLDELEDYDPQNDSGLYLRRRTAATLQNGEQIEAWTYFWNGPREGARAIMSGDFALWLSEEE